MTQGEMAAIIDLNEEDDALRPLTAYRPVGTLPFAGRYRLLDFPLSAVAYAGVHSVALFMPRSARSVQDHVRDGSSWNLDLIQGGVFMFPYMATRDYSDSQLRHRYFDDYTTFLRRSGAPYTVIIGSRNVASVDLAAVLAYHQAGDAPVTVVYKKLAEAEMAPSDWTLTLSEQGTASAVVPTEARREPADADGKVPSFMDTYLLATPDLIDILDAAAENDTFRPLPALLRDYVVANNANAFEYTGYLARITSLQRYFDYSLGMLDEANYQALLFSAVPVLTKSKNEVPTFFARTAKVENSLLGTGSYIEGQINHSVIFRSVVVHQGAAVDNSMIMQGGKIANGSKLSNVILDKGVVIGPNLTLAGTPDQPLVIGKNQTILSAADIPQAAATKA